MLGSRALRLSQATPKKPTAPTVSTPSVRTPNLRVDVQQLTLEWADSTSVNRAIGPCKHNNIRRKSGCCCHRRRTERVRNINSGSRWHSDTDRYGQSVGTSCSTVNWFMCEYRQGKIVDSSNSVCSISLRLVSQLLMRALSPVHRQCAEQAMLGLHGTIIGMSHFCLCNYQSAHCYTFIRQPASTTLLGTHWRTNSHQRPTTNHIPWFRRLSRIHASGASIS